MVAPEGELHAHATFRPMLSAQAEKFRDFRRKTLWTRQNTHCYIAQTVPT